MPLDLKAVIRSIRVPAHEHNQAGAQNDVSNAIDGDFDFHHCGEAYPASDDWSTRFASRSRFRFLLHPSRLERIVAKSSHVNGAVSGYGLITISWRSDWACSGTRPPSLFS
jgi:hypothetical protein